MSSDAFFNVAYDCKYYLFFYLYYVTFVILSKPAMQGFNLSSKPLNPLIARRSAALIRTEVTASAKTKFGLTLPSRV